MSSETARWFEKHPARGSSSVRLFCVPHAGGSGYPYRAWMSHLPDTVELFGVRLPGRGPRIAETAFRRMEALVTALSGAVVEHLDKPFAVLGHSMGALIAFELCARLEQRGFKASHLFVSATRAPHISRTGKPLHLLPRDAFVEELRKFNGTAPELLEDESMISTFLPLLRADFELMETYPVRASAPIPCPITSLGGHGDETVTKQELEEWSRYTTRSFRCFMFPGDHFFITTHAPAVLRTLGETISAI
ncbi:MAG: alpha/beta fold hydrolase [Xanthobacteraceae bacterium]